MTTRSNISGYLLVLAGLTFWLGWFLMPDPGTADAGHLLGVVKYARTSVFYSGFILLGSAVLYLTASFLMVQLFASQNKLVLAGIILFGVGTLGMTADAFYHLLAYHMTDESLVVDVNTLHVMDFIQKGVRFLVAILHCSFYVGTFLLCAGLSRQGVVSKIPLFILLTGIVIIPVALIVSQSLIIIEGHLISLFLVGLVATSHASIGSELIISLRNEDGISDNITTTSTDL